MDLKKIYVIPVMLFFCAGCIDMNNFHKIPVNKKAAFEISPDIKGLNYCFDDLKKILQKIGIVFVLYIRI